MEGPAVGGCGGGGCGVESRRATVRWLPDHGRNGAAGQGGHKVAFVLSAGILKPV